MAVGTVVRFDRRRGYGFVSPEDGAEDVFVHQNNISMEGFRYLQVGEKVNYELEVGEKGMKAVSVALVEPRVERPQGEGEFGGQEDPDERDNPRPRFGERAPRASFDQGDRGADRGPERGADRGGDRPERFDRPERAPRAPRSFGNANSNGADDNGQLEKLRRKQERLLSLLVEKGILAPGEIDGLDAAVEAATANA